MKTVTVQLKSLDSPQIFDWARREPVLLVIDTGEEFILSCADNFDVKVETRRKSERFQKFLEERMAFTNKRSIEALLQEVEAELANEQTHAKLMRP